MHTGPDQGSHSLQTAAFVPISERPDNCAGFIVKFVKHSGNACFVIGLVLRYY